MSDTPTPRTDAEQKRIAFATDIFCSDELASMASFARTLERELAAVAKERDAAIAELSLASQAAGFAEGKLLASETFGVLQGWISRATDAETQRDRLRAALEASATVFDDMDTVMWTNGCPVNYRAAQDEVNELLNSRAALGKEQL